MQPIAKAELFPGIEESADVAVCSLLTKPEHVVAGLPLDRVGLVAPLRSRSDLEWLLDSLGHHPNIRHLVVCGEDLRGTGEALVRLWEGGLDEQGRLPGGRGMLSPELDARAVDTLREHVQLSDWREQSPSRVASGLRSLPQLDRQRDALAMPAGPAPKRKTFLSRKTSFPIFTPDPGDGWLQLLNLTLRIGTAKQTEDGGRMAEALNAIVTMELPAEEGEFPPYFDFNADDFEAYYRRFTTPAPADSAASSWGARLRDWRGADQLEAVGERLARSLDSQSGTIVLLDPEDMGAPEDAPSLVSATFNAVEGRLFGSFVLRSVDVYTDWPFEALSLVCLLRETAARVGLEVGTATFVIHSAYLLEGDWARAQRVLDEWFKRPLPLQVDPSGIFLFGNDGGKARAMLLDHDANTIFWEEAFEDPEDLSWYIIDVMPWLLPQHMRYVGQECASLMRAIRERECYLQG